MTIKAIYVTGDSFSFGQELGGSDVEPKDFYTCTDYMRDNSYTGIIAKTWGIENVINKSLPGGSNDRAFRMITTDLPTYFGDYKPEEIYVFISLTHSTRREFYDNEHKHWEALISNFEPDPKFSYKSQREFWKLYTAYYNSAYESTTRFLSQVLGMQQFLKSLGISYMMSDSMHHDEDFWNEYKKIHTNVLYMIDTDRYYRNEPFNSYVGRKKLPIGKFLHPLEEGHKAWAEHLMGVIYERGNNPK